MTTAPPNVAQTPGTASNTDAAQEIPIPTYQGRPAYWAIYAYPPIGRPDPEYRPVLEWAQNYAAKRWPVGIVRVEHLLSGEEWKREKGEWRLTRPAKQAELGL